MKTPPCIVCGQKLKSASDGRGNQPNNGLEFVTEGHYGSTAFDPMNGSRIAVNICDPCLRSAADRGRVLQHVSGFQYKRWNVNDGNGRRSDHPVWGGPDEQVHRAPEAPSREVAADATQRSAKAQAQDGPHRLD
jgi:hypothetical protein